ncbi:MAG: alanine:cation symporter family protein [Lachnospiraceae bacterium]|jgi:alanine or glycine:cation symporter, AGCS family|nr:alanine:cation symporter family protein [Lachnospiraceae bacterium]MCI1727585.1 alanine:cation symporter family protein [Lachnospiraceae bacterium]
MEGLFNAINNVFGFVTPISDALWDFPKNFDWWANIPVLGNFSLALILLIGSGIFFSFKLGFIQVTHFNRTVKYLAKKEEHRTGISPLAAFFLSTAMRVGPGNIIGVTGAIVAGGPGALFWMWISAFFGMATAYIEATLAQIFKEKKGTEFVGGLPFYGRRLLGNSAAVGVILCVIYLLYAVGCLPSQGSYSVTAIGTIVDTIAGTQMPSNSPFYYIVGILVIALVAVIAFGGIKRVTKFTDMAVPVMAVVYFLVVIVMIVINFDQIPYFFSSVFGGAFKPEAIFGGAFGTALAQGVKRGLMSNEAGQGTITMSAAASDADHPCSQGCIASVGVFLDTIVICTLTGFIIVMSHLWTSVNDFADIDRLQYFQISISGLKPGEPFTVVVSVLLLVCFMLFAFTTLLGMFSFSEIAGSRISQKKGWITTIHIVDLAICAFGILSKIAGYDLSQIWAFSDLANICIVFCNIPILYVGFRYVMKATKHYKKHDGTPFTSEVAGIKEHLYWDDKAQGNG